MLVEIIGIIAGVLTTISFIPQVVKVIRTRSTRDLSLGWLAMAWFGIFLWLMYGVLINNFALEFANGIAFPLISIVLVYKLRYK